jgi:uncharacterized protein
MILREKDRQTLLQIFSRIDISCEVWAYGSRVNGTAHAGSDLDLVIRRKNGGSIPMETLIDLNDKINDSNIPILVELRDWHNLPESFRQQIIKGFEVLFDSSDIMTEADQLLIRNDPSATYVSEKKKE